jgi:AraC-like DNA-binding protein
MNLAVFKDTKFPLVELRYIKQIPECTKMHMHDEITISAIKEGSLNIVFNENSQELLPNEIILINSNIVHSGILNKKSKGEYVLYIDKELLSKNNLQMKTSFELLKNTTFYKEFIDLCNCLLDKTILIVVKEEKLLLFCSLVFTIKEENYEPIDESKLSFKIREYLDLNYLEEINLEELARKFDISIVHLIRVFKNQFGLPIHSYILNKKVHKAKELLTTDMSIVDIAQNSGFFDQSHLNRSFKRVFQLTPKQFQKNMKC